MPRSGSRAPDSLRAVSITPNYLDFAEGSALISWGKTRVLCAASLLDQVPLFKQGTGEGWVTAEYAMLPRSTQVRQPREGAAGGPRGRTLEIQRLIGRSLRAVVDLKTLGEHTVILDCDVLQADGGTRAAAITGAFVALCLALESGRRREILPCLPLKDLVAGVSLGLVDGQLLLDLDYEEDSRAQVDANFVVTGRGELAEVQISGEGCAFPASLLQEMTALAQKGVRALHRLQMEVLDPWLPRFW
uniref:Ribonuclease PH n=1 Tax=Desulfobacca acetoxidans TaxID=60893 RepID=A0A7C3SHS2_9BACT